MKRIVEFRLIVVMSAISSIALPLFAKDKNVSSVFNAAPSQVYDSVYRYAQRHGTIKWADEKRFTLSGVIFVPGGKWDWQKNFDCTISVEPIDGGKKSMVDVAGTFPAKQQSLIGALGEGPAVKVLRAIREDFERVAATPMIATKPAENNQPENSVSDELIRLANSTVEKFRRVDAGFKIDAPADVLTSSLIDAQAQLDEFAAYKSSADSSKLRENLAVALDGFKKARTASGQDKSDALAQARTALAAAAEAVRTDAQSNETVPKSGLRQAVPASSPARQPIPAGSAPPEIIPVTPVTTDHARTVSPQTESNRFMPRTPPPVPALTQAEPVRVTPATKVSNSAHPVDASVNALVDITFASNPPGALVSFSGMAFAATPFVTKLQSGKYRIKMTLAGYPDWETEITVDAGKPSTVVAQLNSTTGVVLK